MSNRTSIFFPFWDFSSLRILKTKNVHHKVFKDMNKLDKNVSTKVKFEAFSCEPETF